MFEALKNLFRTSERSTKLNRSSQRGDADPVLSHRRFVSTCDATPDHQVVYEMFDPGIGGFF